MEGERQGMSSIRTKTTLLTVCAIIVTMVVATLLGVNAIRNIGTSSSDQLLQLMCETGEKNLDYYFENVEQSVEMVSSYADDDLSRLRALDDEQLKAHVERVRNVFEKAAYKTDGTLTYYYRIDPSISDTEKGFWYTNMYGSGFQEHEVTDITLYDTEDTSSLVWFTVPKATGNPIWLPPYITDNLDARVISYNVPIYWKGQFIGVIGIEIDYSTMAEQVNNIQLYDNGYAFINDAEGNIIYHPHMDIATLTGDNKPKVPEGLLSDSAFIKYNYNGVEKQAVWKPLSNGMRLNVTVPVAEINSGWQNLIYEILAVSVILLVIFIAVTMRFTRRITTPLRELTAVAEQVDGGNYDVELNYDGNDEVGILTRTFNKLVRHLKVYISDLNSLAYADALTSVRNKGAFDIFMRELQARVDDPAETPEFAVGIFDCDDLKSINDKYGHDKGDFYLKSSSHLICRVFQHSPVFRVGGDEFAVIIQNDDFRIREELARLFEEQSAEICANAEEPWEQTRVSMGIATYDPQVDRTADDVTRRADKLMYENKRARKAAD